MIIHINMSACYSAKNMFTLLGISIKKECSELLIKHKSI